MVVRTKVLTTLTPCVYVVSTPTGAFLYRIFCNNMLTTKNAQALRLPVTEGLTVTVLPNSDHEFLISTRDVAIGYGISESTIREHRRKNASDFVEGTHFVKGVRKTDTLANSQPHQVFWTKAGVIRLGFFIKSERAKLFRDWAEGLILAVMGHKQPALPIAKPRRINRMTPDRIIDILSDICLIEDKSLRERIANKIKGGHCYGN